MIKIALYEPQIPQNTGNIARLAVGLDINLYLVGKLGFSLNDRYLKRAGLDYWQDLTLKTYDDLPDLIENNKNSRIILATTKGKNLYYNFQFSENDIILFGSETRGLPLDLIKEKLPDFIPEISSTPISTSTIPVATSTETTVLPEIPLITE